MISVPYTTLNNSSINPEIEVNKKFTNFVNVLKCEFTGKKNFFSISQDKITYEIIYMRKNYIRRLLIGLIYRNEQK